MLARPPVLAPNAVAATSHPLASAAAMSVMRMGGTAADAAVAAGAVLCVVEPWASHLGGDGFALVWDADAKRARAIQGSGIAPQSLDVDAFDGDDGIPLRGARSVAAPGMIGAWFHLLTTRGRLAVDQVLAPAIEFAEEGFPVNERWESVGREFQDVVGSDSSLLALFGDKRNPVREGTRIRQPDLAETLRGLAHNGASHFYGGPLGERVASDLEKHGGFLSRADLEGHTTEELEPLSVDLEGGTLLEQPPVSQGVMVLAMMLALEEADHRGWLIDDDSPRAIAREFHLQIEIYRRVRAYRDRFLVDPRFASDKQKWRLEHWIDRKHAVGTIERLDVGSVTPISSPPPTTDVGDTTYLCVADAEGNIVSWIQSIFHPFGAGFVVPGTGIILNNRINGFSLDRSSPNRLEPGKRTVHTLNSWMVLREGQPWLIGGTPGAEKQIQTNVQILRERLVRSGSLATALHAPRWGIEDFDRVAIESRGPSDVRRRLKRLGHDVVRIGPWQGSGLVQAIERLDEGGWLACTDPRGEGTAIGY